MNSDKIKRMLENLDMIDTLAFEVFSEAAEKDQYSGESYGSSKAYGDVVHLLTQLKSVIETAANSLSDENELNSEKLSRKG